MLLLFLFLKLLDQATERLQLTTAARRFYTNDGTQILDAQDLIKWAVKFYKRELERVDQSRTTKMDDITLYSNNRFVKKFLFIKGTTKEDKDGTKPGSGKNRDNEKDAFSKSKSIYVCVCL